MREIRKDFYKRIEDYLNSLDLEHILGKYNVKVKNKVYGKAYKTWKVFNNRAVYCYMKKRQYYTLVIDIKEIKEVLWYG